MSTEILPFLFEGSEVRATLIDGEPWWSLGDVTRALGLSNPSAVAARLDDDEKGVTLIETLGGPQTIGIVNEPGLYSVVLRSDKPEAKRFKRWVTHEVIPQIRRGGSYVVTETPEQFLARAVTVANGVIAAKDEQIQHLAPRAEAWDAIASAEGDYSVGDAAKMLARAGIPTGPQRLFDQLADIKWTYRGEGGKWHAYADRVEKGYLSHRPMFHYHPKSGERVIDPPQLRVTVKGIERLRQRLHVGALAVVS